MSDRRNSSKCECERDEDEKLSYTNVLVPTLLFFAAVFALYPLQLQIIIQVICDKKSDEENDDGDCDDAAISSRAAIVNAYCSIALYLPAILLTGPYGALINRFGRKLGMCIPIIGCILAALCFLYIHTVRPSYFTLVAVLGNFLMGITGSYSTFIVGAFSYASDATTDNPVDRKQAYPIVEGFIFIPKLFIPVGIGLWVKADGFTFPILTTAGLGCLALCWLIFLVPESLPKNSPVRTMPLNIYPIETFRNLSFLYSHKVKRGRSPLLCLSVAFCLYYVSYISFNTVLILYGKHVFNWGPDTIGFFDGLEGGIHAMSMLFAPSFVHNMLGKEVSLLNWIHLGYFCRCLYYICIGVAPSTPFVFATIGLVILTGPIAPFSRTMLSNIVLATEQSKIFAAFSAVESISTLISPLMSILYSICAQNDIPEYVFFVMSLFLLCSFLIICYVRFTPAMRYNLPDEIHSHIMYSSFCSTPSLVDEKVEVDEKERLLSNDLNDNE